MTVTHCTGTLTIVDRLPSSVNGNPRYLLLIGETVCRTAPNSDLAYGVRNFEGKTVRAVVGTYRGKPTLRALELADATA